MHDFQVGETWVVIKDEHPLRKGDEYRVGTSEDGRLKLFGEKYNVIANNYSDEIYFKKIN